MPGEIRMPFRLPWLFALGYDDPMHARFLILAFTLALPAFAAGGVEHPIVVVSGQEGGQYHAVAEAIVEVLGGEPHLALPSQGTVDNLRLLFGGEEGRPQADLAIVQSDTLHRLLNRPRSALPDALRDLQGDPAEVGTLMALFPEYVQAVVLHDSTIHSFWQMEGLPVFLGSPDSGSRLNALDLLDFAASGGRGTDGGEALIAIRETATHGDLLRHSETAAAELNQILRQLGDPPFDPETPDSPVTSRLAFELVKRGKIAAAFTTQGSLIDDPMLRRLYLREDRAEKFRSVFDYYGLHFETPPGEASLGAIPFVRANLVALNNRGDGGLSRADAREITRRLYEHGHDLERLTTVKMNAPVEFFAGDHMVRRVTDQLHAGARDYFKSINIIARVTVTELLFVIPLLLIGLTFLGNAMRNTRPVGRLIQSRLVNRFYQPDTPFQRGWDRYRSSICGSWIAIFIWLFLILFVLVVYFIRFIEKQQSVRLDIANPFAGTSFWEAAFWMVTFASTGFNQGIYPNTLLARILAVLVPLAGLVVTLFVMVTQTFRSARETEKRAQGLLPPPALKDHVILCGWNERVVPLLVEMLSRASPLLPRSKVVVVADPEADKPLEGLAVNRSRVCFYRGRASDPDTLARVHIASAKSAVVLSDDQNVRDHNVRSILACLAVRNRFGEGTDEDAPKPIIAELFYERNRRYFENAGATKLVSLPVIAGRVISHAVLNPGVSGLVLSLLRFSNAQVVRRVSTQEASDGRHGVDVVGLTFWEALARLRAVGWLLLAVHRADRDKHGDAIEIEFRESSPYLFRASGIDADYRIHPDDHLLVVMPNPTPGRGKLCEEWRFLRQGELPAIQEKEERILLVGNGSVGEGIAEALAGRVGKVVWLVSETGRGVRTGGGASEDRLDESAQGNLTRLRWSGRLGEEFFREHREHFKGLTRAVLLGPDRAVCGNSAELNHDDETLLLALTLRKTGGAGMPEFEGLFIAAEMRSRANLPLFHDAGVNQPIPTTALVEQALVQMAFHRGVATEFFLKSMSYSPANQKARLVRMSVSSLSERVGRSVAGLSFDGLLEACAGVRVQLLAIHSTERVGDGRFPLIVNPQPPSLPRGFFRKPRDSPEELVREDDFAFVFDDPAND